MKACARDRVETICLLLQHGADPTLGDLIKQWRALTWAAFNGCDEAIVALVDHAKPGAIHVNVQDRKGR